MTDRDKDDEGILGFDAAYQIGERIVEMADRVRKLDPMVPGAQARCEIEIDDVPFEIILRKKP